MTQLKLDGHKELFRALVGSHNYGLATTDSDEDFKVFVMPTFEDLYYGTQYAHATVGTEADYDVHDIRKLVNLFYKANINFIEVLYSTKIAYSGDAHLVKLVHGIYDMRETLVTMNLPYLYNACGGMSLNKRKLLDKGTEGTQHLVDLHGYDTKQAMHSYRPLNFIVRFAKTDFTDFKYAMTYNEEERKFMLGFKNGDYSKEDFLKFIEDYEEKEFKPLKERYHVQPVNEAAKKALEDLIFNYIKEEMRR